MFLSVISQAGELGKTALSHQVVNFGVFFQFPQVNLNLLLISRRLKTCFLWLCCQTQYSYTPFFRTIVESIFYPRASPDATASSHNVCHFVILFFIVFPVPVSKGQLSSPDSVREDWANCLGRRTFYPVLHVCFSHTHNKAPWNVTDGQVWFMSTGQFVPFVEGSTWPSLDTCSTSETNVYTRASR